MADEYQLSIKKNLPFEEAEVFIEHVISKPDFSVGIEEDLVEVVSYSTTVLYLSDHVTHGTPRYS